ncbi:alpha/beta hydrolase fold domain-containing protein [Clostridium polynesiense]|uniref:alpha/beta hydrolase fold domain-containing protein n=1 Tax=Clostridium polynesiense TaxID=1325933 RepID=UPI000694611A|nr:alpha/beta hydrolase [Clostridium polynesiense]
MESLQSRFFKLLMKITRQKDFWMLTGKDFEKALYKNSQQEHTPPKGIYKSVNVNSDEFEGFNYYILSPKRGKSKRRIFYIHGGGFVYEMNPLHWKFLAKLCKTLKMEIAVPIYPLLPEYTYEDAYPFVFNLYIKELEKVDNPEDMVLMGDSAGGGFALSLAQYFKKNDVKQPGDIVLLSPTVDLTLKNKAMDVVDKNDPILSKPGILEVRKLYGNSLDPKSCKASPLYGDLEGLGEITVFIGTYDILYPDTKN